MKWGNGRFLPKKKKKERKWKLAKQKDRLLPANFFWNFSFKKGKKTEGGDDNMRTKQKVRNPLINVRRTGWRIDCHEAFILEEAVEFYDGWDRIFGEQNLKGLRRGPAFLINYLRKDCQQTKEYLRRQRVPIQFTVTVGWWCILIFLTQWDRRPSYRICTCIFVFHLIILPYEYHHL